MEKIYKLTVRSKAQSSPIVKLYRVDEADIYLILKHASHAVVPAGYECRVDIELYDYANVDYDLTKIPYE